MDDDKKLVINENNPEKGPLSFITGSILGSLIALSFNQKK